MKKLLCIVLGLMLLLTLTACGEKPASVPVSSGASVSADVSTPEVPEEQEQPDVPIPDEPEQGGAWSDPEEPDEPEVPIEEPGKSVYADARTVTFSGLADGHTVEVQLEDGSYAALQFDSDQYGGVMSALAEGDVIVIRMDAVQLSGGGTAWQLTEYLGSALQGVILLDSQTPDHYDWEVVGDEESNQSFALYATQALSGVTLYPLTFQDDGSLKKGEMWLSREEVYEGAFLKFNLFVEEYYPNWLLEYTLADGTQVRYLIGMAEEPLYLPVCLSPALSRLAE